MKRICIFVTIVSLAVCVFNACMANDEEDLLTQRNQIGRDLYAGNYDGYWTVNGEQADSASLYVGAYVDINNMPRNYIIAHFYPESIVSHFSIKEEDYGLPMHYIVNGVSHDSYYFTFDKSDYNFRYVARDTIFTSTYAIDKSSVAIYNRYTNSFVIKIKINSVTDSYLENIVSPSDKNETWRRVSLRRPVPELSLVFTGIKRKENRK